MKTSALIIIATCLLQPQLHAQFSIRPELGINISNYQIRDEYYTYNTQAKASPLAGIAVEAVLSPKVAITSGLYYMQNGFKWRSFEHTDNLTIQCIELPLNVLYTPGKNLSFGFGGYGVYHAQGSVESNGMSSTLKFAYSTNSSQYYVSKPFDFGFRIVSVMKLSEKIYLKAHYQRTIGNLAFGADAPDVMFHVKNYNYGLSLGYNLFSWGKKKG